MSDPCRHRIHGPPSASGVEADRYYCRICLAPVCEAEARTRGAIAHCLAASQALSGIPQRKESGVLLRSEGRHVASTIGFLRRLHARLLASPAKELE